MQNGENTNNIKVTLETNLGSFVPDINKFLKILANFRYYNKELLNLAFGEKVAKQYKKFLDSLPKEKDPIVIEDILKKSGGTKNTIVDMDFFKSILQLSERRQPNEFIRTFSNPEGGLQNMFLDYLESNTKKFETGKNIDGLLDKFFQVALSNKKFRNQSGANVYKDLENKFNIGTKNKLLQFSSQFNNLANEFESIEFKTEHAEKIFNKFKLNINEEKIAKAAEFVNIVKGMSEIHSKLFRVSTKHVKSFDENGAEIDSVVKSLVPKYSDLMMKKFDVLFNTPSDKNLQAAESLLNVLQKRNIKVGNLPRYTPIIDRENYLKLLKNPSADNLTEATKLFKEIKNNHKLISEIKKKSGLETVELNKIIKQNSLNSYKSIFDFFGLQKISPDRQKYITELYTTYKNRFKDIPYIENDFLQLSSLMGKEINEKNFEKVNKKYNSMILGQEKLMELKKTLSFDEDAVSKLSQEKSFKTYKTINDHLQHLVKLQKESNKFLSAKSDTEIFKEKYSLSHKWFRELESKIKTIFLYYFVFNTYGFVKDIFKQRLEYEQQTALISGAIENFSDYNNKPHLDRFQSSKEVIELLKKQANTLGITYDNITEGFAKMSMAVPANKMSLNQMLGSYVSILKILSATGASDIEKQTAITALYQMVGKPKLSSEEFTKQLGNTPIRGHLLRMMIKAINEDFDKKFTTFEEVQKFTTQKNIAPYEVLWRTSRRINDDSSFKNNLIANTIFADTNRLTNAWNDFKLSLTAGMTDGFNPLVNEISSLIQTVTALTKEMSSIAPTLLTLIHLGGFGFTAYKAKQSFSSVQQRKINQISTDIYNSYKDGNTLQALQLTSTAASSNFKSMTGFLFSSVGGYLAMSSAFDGFRKYSQNMDFMDKIVNSLNLFMGAVGLFSGLSGLMQQIKQARIIARSTEIVGMLSTGFLAKYLFPIVAGILTTMGIGYLLYKAFFKKDKKSYEEENSLDSDMYVNGYAIQQNSHAQVDIHADFPVSGASINEDNLSVNIFGDNLIPANNF